MNISIITCCLILPVIWTLVGILNIRMGSPVFGYSLIGTAVLLLGTGIVLLIRGGK